jgi:hypothetical protein
VRGALKGWTAESGRDGGYCKWSSDNMAEYSRDASPYKSVAPMVATVLCDADGNVAELGLRGGRLGGALPDGALLARLPALRALLLGNASLSGTLPNNWGGLGLEQLFILGDGGAGAGDGRGITGTIPAAWGALKKLRMFTLS